MTKAEILATIGREHDRVTADSARRLWHALSRDGWRDEDIEAEVDAFLYCAAETRAEALTIAATKLHEALAALRADQR